MNRRNRFRIYRFGRKRFGGNLLSGKFRIAMQAVSGLCVFLFFTSIVFSQPNPRHFEEVTYDKEGNKLLLFGGIEMIKDGWAEPAMVYEWDGKNWHSKEVKGPLGRRAHVWVYDESRKETLIDRGE